MAERQPGIIGKELHPPRQTRVFPGALVLKAVGFSDADLARPIVGISNAWTETMPCTFTVRRLVDYY